MPRWQNWARLVTTHPRDLVRPPDAAALGALVARAAEEGRRVRVPGSGHAWSACAAPEDLWVALDGLPTGVEVRGDEVLVRGPVRLHALVAALQAAGRMLPNLGTITAQTVPGVTATGTHGTGLGLPIVSAGILGLTLVDGQGRLRELGPGDPALRDARVHLGTLGVVTALTLRTVPARRLHERLENLSLDAALDGLPEALARHRHLRLWWLPHSGRVQRYTADLSDAPDTGPNALAVRMDRWGLQQPLFAALLALGGRLPALVPWIHRLAQATSFPPRERVEAQPLVLTMPVPPRHQEVELALPVEATAPALRDWWALTHRLPHAPDFIQEVRFVQGDDIALSPATGRDSVYLGAYCTNPATATRYFAEVLAFGRAFGARPHWGKQFDHEAAELRTLYPRWDDFQALRAAFDPAGVFRSTWTDRVLGGPAG